MPRPTWLAPAGVVILLLAGAAAWWWQRGGEPAVVAPPPTPVTEQRAEAPAAPAEPAASEPLPPAARPDEPPLPRDDTAVRQALVDLLGRDAVLRLVQGDGFARRVAATVDNLARPHAAPRLWPVNPTAGRFAVDDDGRITEANARRYDALLGVVLAIDAPRAAALYRRLLPQLQAAYEELGYPGRSFHARLVAVIDHLVATEVPREPPRTVLTDVKGPIAPERPWVRHEYADPALEAASAGRRILWRLGAERQRRVQDWLRALRAEITR
ncbi:MAG: DUF3014 domain-containing protein [Rubrivivax sp.]|nr:DUF3014 domain-containing protein [Rubrivivax sp.]